MYTEEDYDEGPAPSRWRRAAPFLGVVAVTVAICVIVLTLIDDGNGKRKKPVPEVVQLRIVQPPPPPQPPPPQKVEQPKMKQPEFKPLEAPPEPQSEPPPGPPALDAAGAGPGDAFGLQGRPGGSSYGGGGGGGGGSPFGWYVAMVQQSAKAALDQQRRLREKPYRITALIWIAADGSAERVQLLRSSGDAETDQLLERSLMGMRRLSGGPPKGMPQPVVVRVKAA